MSIICSKFILVDAKSIGSRLGEHESCCANVNCSFVHIQYERYVSLLGSMVYACHWTVRRSIVIFTTTPTSSIKTDNTRTAFHLLEVTRLSSATTDARLDATLVEL